jgi:hypothetical protein
MKDIDAELSRIESLELDQQITELAKLIEELENSLK